MQKDGDGTRKERYVVISLDESGAAVESAYSLTGDWAVVGTSVGKAPTLEGGKEEEGGSGERGLLLRIEGTEGWAAESWEEGKEPERELEELCEVFGRRMGELRAVVEGGGAGMAVEVARAEEM